MVGTDSAQLRAYDLLHITRGYWDLTNAHVLGWAEGKKCGLLEDPEWLGHDYITVLNINKTSWNET